MNCELIHCQTMRVVPVKFSDLPLQPFFINLLDSPPAYIRFLSCIRYCFFLGPMFNVQPQTLGIPMVRRKPLNILVASMTAMVAIHTTNTDLQLNEHVEHRTICNASGDVFVN